MNEYLLLVVGDGWKWAIQLKPEPAIIKEGDPTPEQIIGAIEKHINEQREIGGI